MYYAWKATLSSRICAAALRLRRPASATGQTAGVRRGVSAEENRALGHQHSAERCRAPARRRQRWPGAQGLRGEVSVLPRRERRRQAGRSARGGIVSLAGKTPQRTVGSYWPYATTLFDYVRRAMPITNPLSLTDDEVYAVSAYVLFLNGIVGEDAVLNAQTLPQVRMPNHDGFVSDWAARARN